MKKLNHVKHIVVISLISALLIGGNAMAAEMVDGSLLTKENESSGTTEIMPRGAYLQSGYSNISKMGTGQIAAGGTTNAQTTVSTVKISVIVEKYVGGNWYQYTSWSESKNNAYQIFSSRGLTVPTGYYYRTRCIHSANSDMSSSQTNGLYV